MRVRGPVFQGKPSPSLRVMEYLTPEELRERIDRMEQERQRILARLQDRRQRGIKTQRDVVAAALEQRLRLLIEQGTKMLDV